LAHVRTQEAEPIVEALHEDAVLGRAGALAVRVEAVVAFQVAGQQTPGVAVQRIDPGLLLVRG